MRFNAVLRAWATALTFCVLIGCAGPRVEPPIATVLPFAATAIDGRDISHDALKGRVWLANLWGTWCAPCIAEIPDLIALRDRYPEQVEVLGISVYETDMEDVRQFAADHEISYPLIEGTETVLAAFPDSMGIVPTSFLIDADGSVRQVYIGPVEPDAVHRDVESILRAGASR